MKRKVCSEQRSSKCFENNTAQSLRRIHTHTYGEVDKHANEKKTKKYTYFSEKSNPQAALYVHMSQIELIERSGPRN